MKTKFFSSESLRPGVQVISGMQGEKCYLIEGTERALLFDGLAGAGSLKAYVRELTDLPVFLVLSHAHPDHLGAAFEYGACFLHPDDMGLFYTRFAASWENRYDYLSRELPYAPPHRVKLTPEDMCLPRPVQFFPVNDGDCFDLGGRELEVVAVPGHTRGSICLLDRADRTLYSGDAINMNTLFLPHGSTTIEEYLESLERLKTRVPCFDRLYGGHDPRPIPASIVDDGIALCQRILAGTDDALDEPGSYGMGKRALRVGPSFMPENGSLCNIFYTPELVHGRLEKRVLTGTPYVDGKDIQFVSF